MIPFNRRWRCLSQPHTRLLIWVLAVIVLAVVVLVIQVPLHLALGIAVGGVVVSHAVITWVAKGLPGADGPAAATG